ncbi:preprotein translocase subunit YajC [Bifidobacterium goeldii]|uniref:Preprotein translocase subunit YajC n=1 Tax=Bifidobacterium goeldii TaxID=2306975 RepID=A0A430FLW5_9BIFI|nr:preprotein translocase subunit YajC [Bifidobacterium goeldii]RSX53770.1 preprotein translocase subunit YajC [Bifidobacterium goeldii]
MDPTMLVMLVFIVLMIVMMMVQQRKSKKQQADIRDFRANLAPGTEVITIGGVIGKVVSVDTEYEEIVIDSEGSKMRFSFRAINKEYTRPAFIHDDEVDENGNPLPKDDDDKDQAQVPVDTAVTAADAGTAIAEADAK